jgi:broad specificity phosphatase PhoE
MPTKLLHLVRHGHSVQNHTMETIGARLIGADPDTIEMRSLMGVFPEVLEEMKTLTLERDSPLTPKGQQQAESLKGRASFLQPPHVELVVASTQRRALLTASIVNGEAIAAGELRAVSLDDAREFLSSPFDDSGIGESDLRSTVTVHQTRFPGWDFSQVPEEPPELQDPSLAEGTMTHGPDSMDAAMIAARGKRVLAFICAQPESRVSLFSHGGFLAKGILETVLSESDHEKFEVGNFGAGTNARFRAVIYVQKLIALPRRARDKHKELPVLKNGDLFIRQLRVRHLAAVRPGRPRGVSRHAGRRAHQVGDQPRPGKEARLFAPFYTKK